LVGTAEKSSSLRLDHLTFEESRRAGYFAKKIKASSMS